MPCFSNQACTANKKLAATNALDIAFGLAFTRRLDWIWKSPLWFVFRLIFLSFLFVLKFSFFFGRGILVLLVFGHQVIHIGLGLKRKKRLGWTSFRLVCLWHMKKRWESTRFHNMGILLQVTFFNRKRIRWVRNSELYMGAWRYGISVRVFNSVSHELPQTHVKNYRNFSRVMIRLEIPVKHSSLYHKVPSFSVL